MWRKYQLSKHLTKEGHPLRKFSTGDKNSLSNPELSTLLHRFYRSHYSSNLMKLVIYGNQDLDSLTKTAESLFSEIPNH
jgi:insulysin